MASDGIAKKPRNTIGAHTPSNSPEAGRPKTMTYYEEWRDALKTIANLEKQIGSYGLCPVCVRGYLFPEKRPKQEWVYRCDARGCHKCFKWQKVES